MRCPCGRALDYAQCCGRWHGDSAAAMPIPIPIPMDCAAPDAETLMRSRYSAYVLGRHDYLLATWQARTRPVAIDAQDGVATHWLGLEVRAHHCDSADSARVEFVARYKQGGRATRLHEVSRFVREGGRWFYVDGDVDAR